MSNRAIASALEVSDKTVAKAAAGSAASRDVVVQIRKGFS